MWNNAPPSLPGYAFHACLCPCPRPVHQIGCVELSESMLAIWAVRMGSTDGRSKLISELHTALTADAPNAALKALNDGLCKAYPDASNCAEICVLVLDGSGHSLEITTAGDFLPQLRTPDGSIVQLDRAANGIPLGLATSMEYATQVVPLAAKTLVFWISPYTTQIQNASGELYGIYGIPDQIRAAPREPTLMLEWIANDIEAYIGNREQSEDICMICLQRIE